MTARRSVPGTPDPWSALRRHTAARIALGRSGDSLPTSALLEFGLAHALARDAVHLPLDGAALATALDAVGLAHLAVHSQAADRATYLRRPDLGRQLTPDSLATLEKAAPATAPDLVFVIADGLSSLAVARHALPLLHATLGQLPGWSIAPVVIAEQARVALGDAIGEALGAATVVILIGERPGLSSPDSLGIYLTHRPRPGLTDADRNCISNVRPEGLSYAVAARKLTYLLDGARRLGRSGLALKDDSSLEALPGAAPLAPPD
ncbi:ethanolamine ammonia-lyase subunit EutC [Dechloromonas sp. A34]|uniref:ethanolamine ammonia-lyase subunit EutC n=1 Tax=Dechloromonas sp. A34 TaxID=447588 RepID=UPI002248C6B2|nr:ethanolamine ammonia-lyase subunit EutC [Dechloromonas sp. A34]